MATILRRNSGENDAEFMERAAMVAVKVGGSIDGGHGKLCPNCATSSEPVGDEVEIVPVPSCYNCEN